MTITINEATKRITIEQSDLTLVSGTLYELNTETLRNGLNDLMDDERYMWMDDYAIRNAPVTVAGTTFAQTIEIVNGYSVEFDDTPGAYTVRLAGSNNNLFDVENSILAPNQVNVIATNSAGLIVTQSGDNVDTDAVIQVVEDWGVINYSK